MISLESPFARLMPMLRCPDCFETRLSRSDDSQQMEAIICEACGRGMKVAGGLLDALPRTLQRSNTANLDYYDRLSDDEENILARRAATRNHKIKESVVRGALQLNDRSPARPILEMGTGYGAHGAAIQSWGGRYVGLDISAGLLRQARQRFPALSEAALVVGDATRTPFRDGVFDGVFCVATLHHLPEPARGVREMIRVLAPGGRFCFLEPRRFYPTTLIQYMRFPQTEVSVLKMSPGNLTRWARAAGASAVGCSHHVFTPNGPASLQPIFDRIDRWAEGAAPLHLFSVMFCVHGEK